MKFGKMALLGGLLAFSTGPWAEPAEQEGSQPPSEGAPARVAAPSATPDPLLSVSNTSTFVNEFTGQAAFTIPLGSISNHGGISHAVNLQYYGGGLEHNAARKRELTPTSWVGEGFSLKAPYILADPKGTVAAGDDSYTLSLDGLTQWELIPETDNPNTLYPKIRPYIQVTRSASSLYQPWVVTMQDGAKYHFASPAAAGACDGPAAGNALCLPVKDPLFHPVPQDDKAPVLWHLSSIESRDGAFRIFFEYHKVIADNAHRAIYLKRIYAVNGNTTSSDIVSEILFHRENKWDAVDNSFRDPLAQFETQRLDSVILKNQGQITRVFHFKYQGEPGEQAGGDRTRLTRIREGLDQHERNYYRCVYDAANPWQIKKVFGPSGLAWEYGYAPASVDAVAQAVNLGDILQVPLQVGFTGEFNGKYYVLLSTVPNSEGGTFPRRLYEFEHRGAHWKLLRTYTIGPGDAAFAMAPDGSYFAVATGGTGEALEKHVLRLFNPSAEGLVEPEINLNADAFPEGFLVREDTLSLRNIPSSWLFLKDKTAPQVGPRIFAFNDWLATYRPGYGTVAFLNKEGSNWTAVRPAYGPPSSMPDAWVLPSSTSASTGLGFSLVSSPPSSPYLTWSKLAAPFDIRLLDVRQGDNFIAVVLRNFGGGGGTEWTIGGAVRIFAKVSGEIGWVDHSNNERKTDLNLSVPNPVTTWGGGDKGPGASQDRLLDVSVHGDLVGLLVRHPYAQYIFNRYLHTFAVNLAQNKLDHVYSKVLGANFSNNDHAVEYKTTFNDISRDDSHIYMGSNFLLYKRRLKDFQGFASHDFRIEAHQFNRETKQADVIQVPYRSAFPVNQTHPLPRFNTVVKIMGDHFFLETMNKTINKDTIVNILPAYRQVVAGQAYPVTAAGRLYRINPKRGSAAANVEEIQITHLNQLTLHGDRYLAYNNAAGARNYVYGRINEQGITSDIVDKTSSQLPMIALLTPSGVLDLDLLETGPRFRFYDGFKGALSPSSVLAINQVKISTKGSGSSSIDGSEQTIQFDYSDGQAQFNAKGKTPNFKQVKRLLAGPASETITEYATDFEESGLEDAAQILHGMPVKTISRPGPVAGRQPGERETQNEYIAEALSDRNGQALRKQAHAVRLRKRTEKMFFFNGQRKSETRYTAFDEKNGLPRITITKNGGVYRVQAIRFEHEIAAMNQQPAPKSNTLVRQSADYSFKSATDICSGTEGDPCNTVDFDWLTSEAQRGRAVSSQVFDYDEEGDMQAVSTWRKKSDTTGLHTLDGVAAIPQGETEASAGKWVKEVEVLSRAKDVTGARSRHSGPAVTDNRGVKTTTFYGGLEGLPLAVAENAGKTVCTFLGAEEENTGTGFGAFGDWEPIGSVSTTMAHSGLRSIRSAGAFGPSINIHFKQDTAFWARKKGLVISGWMFVPGVKSMDSTVNPFPWAAVELRTAYNAHPSRVIHLIPEYEAAQGPFPYNRWVKLETRLTWKDLEAIGGADPVVRVWFGKAETPLNEAPQNTLPVYVDDLRIHPADAVMTSRAYDVHGRETAVLDAANLPVFPLYDVWNMPVGTRDDRGEVFSVTAEKRVGED